MSQPEREVHIIHHYHKEPIRSKKARKPRNRNKKLIKVACNIIEEIVRLI